jgi:hypothetical protein
MIMLLLLMCAGGGGGQPGGILGPPAAIPGPPALPPPPAGIPGIWNLPPAPVPVPPLLLPAVPQWQLLPPNAAVGRFHWHAGPGDITTWLASDVFTQPGMPNSTVISLLPLTFPTDGNSLSSPEVWLARDTKIPQNAGSRRDGGPRWGLDSLAF